MVVIYREEDADLQVLAGRKIGVIGYGNLGRPIALNLRDSGLDVIVGLRELTPDRLEEVTEDGFAALEVGEVVDRADILLLLVPDEVLPEVFIDQIAGRLRRGHTLILASGYNVRYNNIEAPSFVDVGLIAPRTFGPAVRARYLNAEGFFSFVAVAQDASGQIWPTMLALALAMGSLRKGALELTIEQETEIDLFIQQAVLPGVYRILTAAAGLLLNRGYPPEAVMLDLAMSGELIDYLQNAGDAGLIGALRQVSLTEQYGVLSRAARLDEMKLERQMERSLEEILDGGFQKEWSREYSRGYPNLLKWLASQEKLELWELEQETLNLLRRV